MTRDAGEQTDAWVPQLEADFAAFRQPPLEERLRRRAKHQRAQPPPRHAAVCAACGRPFTPKQRRSMFCSRPCRQRAYRHRVQPPPHREATCAACGHAFTPRRRNSRFCSTDCRLRAYRQRPHAAQEAPPP
jgi:hypothetical protein